MELLLWRWSTTAQIASALTIAIFFVVLIRSVGRDELRPWVAGWLANLGALAVTCIFWLAQPENETVFAVLRFVYFFFKTLFVACLTLGAARFVHRGRLPRERLFVIGVVAVLAGFAAATLKGIVYIGIAQSSAIALILGIGAVLLFRNRNAGAAWLGAGFLVRALLAVIEAAAYASRIFPNAWSGEKAIDIFLASHSSFDAGAEWVIALGCLLMLHGVIQHELTMSNRDLRATKEMLQGLVERDPLTGLANRRGLDSIWPALVNSGASIVFFDLNGFKRINDTLGHAAGDECLKRFARALLVSFGPADHLVRYAGDEFVVIATGNQLDRLANNVTSLQERLRFDDSGPEIRFSSGMSFLPVGGTPATALQAADDAMYRDKEAHRALA